MVAGVQSYTVDLVNQIKNDPNTSLDSGNGFLFNDGTTFGYAAGPVKLSRILVITTNEHSPIIGWAADGNPIYGPYGYGNGQTDSGGILRAYSGWSLRTDRVGIFSDNGLYTGTNPPSVARIPMGTFIEDYVYTGQNTTYSAGRINTQSQKDVQAENLDHINAQTIPGFILDENNGRVCNTPEFPKNCTLMEYIATLSCNTPYYPYVIGEKFQNLPIDLEVIIEL